MPGCFTPTEILDAWDAGADIVKVFPATALGPGFIKDVRGPLPQVKLMPTGGVTLDNAGDWIRAGAVAVGVGTALDRRARRSPRATTPRSRANAERIVANVARRAGQARHEPRSSPSARSCCGSARRVRALSAVARASARHSAAAKPTSPSASRSSASRASYVTRLPTHAIGDAAIRALRAEGVQTDHIVRGGSRVGIYFAEAGASQRASTVIYDRARSAISEMEPDAVDWHDVFAGAAWFHVTGITPALGAKARRVRRARAIAAREGAGARGQRRSELPEEALDRGAGAGGRCGR